MINAYVCLPNVLVRCVNDCGGYLAKRDGEFARVQGQEDAARFEGESKGWQASMAAGWGNVVPPDHVPHRRLYGPNGRILLCDGGGAGDCEEVRAAKFAIVCPDCRADGWRLTQDPAGASRA